MITLIKNGTVISMDLKRDKQFEIMDVVFSDNKIIYVGNGYHGEYDKVIDATGKIVMP